MAYSENKTFPFGAVNVTAKARSNVDLHMRRTKLRESSS